LQKKNESAKLLEYRSAYLFNIYSHHENTTDQAIGTVVMGFDKRIIILIAAAKNETTIRWWADLKYFKCSWSVPKIWDGFCGVLGAMKTHKD